MGQPHEDRDIRRECRRLAVQLLQPNHEDRDIRRGALDTAFVAHDFHKRMRRFKRLPEIDHPKRKMTGEFSAILATDFSDFNRLN